MQIKFLPLEQYVEKFHERRRPGWRYLTQDRMIYRLRGRESEDIGELPAGCEAADVPTLGLEGGQYVGDADSVARLAGMCRELLVLVDEIEQVLRS